MLHDGSMSENTTNDFFEAASAECVEDALASTLAPYYREAIQLGFLGPREEERLRLRHFADAWGLAAVISPQPGAAWVDLGSGAGLPGLPLAARYLETAFTLVDAHGRRTDWLRSVVRDLNLGNVEVVCGRLEDVGRDMHFRGRFDVAVARALGRSAVVVELGLPLLRRAGDLLIPRGRFENEERQELEGCLRVLRGKLAAVQPNAADPSGNGVVLVVAKVGSTPARFPRAVGIPQRVALPTS